MTRLRHIRGALVAIAAILATTLTAGDGRAQPAGGDSVIGYALENLVSGTSATVHVGETIYAVTPTRTWKSVSGHWCRRYEMTVTEPGSASQSSEATRCRQGGLWLEPPAE